MRKFIMTTLAMGVLALGTLALAASPAAAQMQLQPSRDVTFTAQVVDLSCKLVYDLSGEDHRVCAEVCADAGVPLGLMSEDGRFFLPVTTAMPGTGANDELKPYAEQTVTVKGKAFRRAGMNTIVIESITAG